MDKTLQLLGLAKKANKIITGEEFVTDAIRKKKIFLVFLASDAGVNTTKKITDKTKYYEVPLINSYTSDELSYIIGKKRMVIGISDAGFATSIEKGCDSYGKKVEK
ncbi:MAG: ribosomal L7Ae/L30e/S12e/Gadd45 family protein [Acholeplasmatales bacterium]|nr:ribosomal L7Ae/L30e/S12e/Gadd45 family protein [Acholeplasmatales bacterium]